MADRFDDLPILDELRAALDAAFAREQARMRPGGSRVRRSARALAPRTFSIGPLHGLPLLIAIALGVGATAAAATLLVLRVAVIPAPALRDIAPALRVVPGTARVNATTAADPGGGPRWAIRTTRSATGLVCSTVGQTVGGAFGIVGLDHRFRLLPEAIVDGCGTPVRGRATLLAARLFDADTPAAVRTVLSGDAGRQLRSVRVSTLHGSFTVPVGAGGVFVAALRGYPEDSAPEVQLRFADGSTQRRRFSGAVGVARDPLGGPALKTELLEFSGHPQRCVRVYAARVAPLAPTGPFACVLPRRDAAFLAARRLQPGDHGRYGELWDWHDGPRRTIVWGYTRQRVRIILLGAGRPRELIRSPEGTFLVILPPAIDPANLSMRLESTAPGAAPSRRTLRPGQGVTAIPDLSRPRPRRHR